MRRFLLLVAGVLTIGLSALAQDGGGYSKMSPRTKILLEQFRGKNSAAKVQMAGVDMKDKESPKLEGFVEVVSEDGWDELMLAGCEIRTKVGMKATVSIPIDQVDRLSSLESIKYIEAASPVSFDLNNAHRFSNTDSIYRGIDLEQPYTGKDVIVGVVDGGFEFSHPTFYSSDGSELRIKYVWNQNNNAEYTDANAIANAPSDNESETHGTHVAGIAAGSGNTRAMYKGVAYESDIYLVGTTMVNTDVVDGIARIKEKAQQAGKPCVVNLSLGSQLGPHDGTDNLSQMVDDMVEPGFLVVYAASNDADAKVSVLLDTSSPEDTVTTYLSPVNDYGATSMAVADCWASEENKPFDVRVYLYDVTSGVAVDTTDIYSCEELDGSNFELVHPTTRERYSGSVFTEKNVNNDKYHAQVYCYSNKEITGVYFKIEVSNSEAERVFAWAYSGRFTSIAGDPMSVDGGIPYSLGNDAAGKEVVSVGSYVTRGGGSTGISIGEISVFSSRGPSADGRLKPEVAAPGEVICSSMKDGFGSLGIRPSSSRFNNKTYYWGGLQGTSMAAPFVTGCLALWLQARPDLTYEEVVDAFQHTAVRDKEMEYPNTTYGYGKIDAYRGLRYLMGFDSAIEDVELTEEEAVSVYAGRSRGEIRMHWLVAPGDFTVTVYDTAGRTLHLSRESGGNSDYVLHAPVYASGVYLVQIVTPEKKIVRKIVVR